jgi:hypothetical protein
MALLIEYKVNRNIGNASINAWPASLNRLPMNHAIDDSGIGDKMIYENREARKCS